MDLKKRINFTWKKEDNFVVSLFYFFVSFFNWEKFMSR